MNFYKRYCFLHPKTRNVLVHFLTETVPFSQTLHERALSQKDQLNQLNKAFGLNVEELSLIKDRTPPEPYQILEKIPSEFWLHKCFAKLPALSKYRRDLCVKIVDQHHRKRCTDTDFHLEAKESCICKICGRQNEWYHECITVDTLV